MVRVNSCFRFSEEWSEWVGSILEYNGVPFWLSVKAQHLPWLPFTLMLNCIWRVNMFCFQLQTSQMVRFVLVTLKISLIDTFCIITVIDWAPGCKFVCIASLEIDTPDTCCTNVNLYSFYCCCNVIKSKNAACTNGILEQCMRSRGALGYAPLHLIWRNFLPVIKQMKASEPTRW